MKVLIDTHVLIWAATSPEKLSKPAARVIEEEQNEILVSAASAWEIATKVRLGKMPGASTFEANLIERLVASRYTLLPITVQDGLRAGRLIGPHQDPFDRMIAAQALSEDIALISADTKLDAIGVRRIW